MEKPEDKKATSGPLRPPHPPPGGNKLGGVPKGPVPPRGGMQIPGMKPLARPPMPPPAAPPPAMSKPPVPPMAPSSMPPVPPSGMKLPPGVPMSPPPGAATPPSGPFGSAMSNKMAEVDAVKANMEQQIADLEKKLLEEKERVLLASLRTKEEEAVSAKVESSIKEIQDKLRREKREQELDEARRKSEARALDLERRMAEEREAWVSTLKTQLSQRDQVTQEMETHFSSRLKDLEYRWAQEKSGLENAVREREAELTRVRHEMQIKSEQEKAFWEDRVKSISAEREKLDRDFERSKDKFTQEKDHLLLERQSLREQISKSEAMLKFIEEQHRVEKAALLREAEAQLNLFKQQMMIEKEAHEKQSNGAKEQVQSYTHEISEKNSRITSLDQQLAAARAQAAQMDFLIKEKERTIEDLKRKTAESNGLTDMQRKKYEMDLEQLRNDLDRARNSSKEEVSRAQVEADSRVKILQARLDWYDSNVKREYEQARAQVRGETEQLTLKLEDAAKTIARLRIVEKERQEAEAHSLALIDKANQDRLGAQETLEQVKAEWKQAQWNFEAQLKEISDQARSAQIKLDQAEDARINLEQELRQRNSNAEYIQGQMELREFEVKKLTDRNENLLKDLDLANEKEAVMESQVADYKNVLQGKGLEGVEDIRLQLQSKAAALEKARESIQDLNLRLQDAEKKNDLFNEKEHALKQVISSKEDVSSEYKNRLAVVDRKIQQLQQEYDEFRAQAKSEKERVMLTKQSEIDDVKVQIQDQLQKVETKHQRELEEVKRLAMEEMEGKLRSSEVSRGPDAQTIETQVRQNMESEILDRLREKETDFEEKLKQIQDESKKEIDKLKWDGDAARAEAKRARDARSQIEKEAQELLQQADSHYQRELAKQLEEKSRGKASPRGLFSKLGLGIGKILDTPIIDTKKNKDDLSSSS